MNQTFLSKKKKITKTPKRRFSKGENESIYDVKKKHVFLAVKQLVLVGGQIKCYSAYLHNIDVILVTLTQPKLFTSLKNIHMKSAKWSFSNRRNV